MSLPGHGLAPLFGIAIDLTPFDVVGSAVPKADVPVAHGALQGMPAALPARVPKSAGRTLSSPRVVVVGQHGNQTFALAAVGMAALILMVIVPSSPSVRPNPAQVAAAPADAPPASAVKSSVKQADAKPLVTVKTGPKSKPRAKRPSADPAASGPNRTAPEGSDSPAEPLATTLERLRVGMR